VVDVAVEPGVGRGDDDRPAVVVHQDRPDHAPPVGAEVHPGPFVDDDPLELGPQSPEGLDRFGASDVETAAVLQRQGELGVVELDPFEVFGPRLHVFQPDRLGLRVVGCEPDHIPALRDAFMGRLELVPAGTVPDHASDPGSA
jgi:hypothetical protein